MGLKAERVQTPVRGVLQVLPCDAVDSQTQSVQ